MNDIKKKTAEIFVAIGANLAKVIAESSFEFWQRNDFRLYVEFSNISQTEQDRIFNELEVSIIGLCILNLDSVYERVDKNFQPIIKILQKEIPAGFIDLLASSGIEASYLKEWDTLIDMRLKEYRDDFKLSLRESQKMKEFKKNEEDLRISWARIQTMTIDCLTHIRRGKIEKNDPLWSLLRKWLITLDSSIITPISKLALKA